MIQDIQDTKIYMRQDIQDKISLVIILHSQVTRIHKDIQYYGRLG